MDEHGAPLFYQTFLNNIWDQPKLITLQGIASLVVNAAESEKLSLAPGTQQRLKLGGLKSPRMQWQPMPTPKDGALKTDLETYPATAAGKEQYPSGTHVD